MNGSAALKEMRGPLGLVAPIRRVRSRRARCAGNQVSVEPRTFPTPLRRRRCRELAAQLAECYEAHISVNRIPGWAAAGVVVAMLCATAVAELDTASDIDQLVGEMAKLSCKHPSVADVRDTGTPNTSGTTEFQVIC